MQKLSEKLLVVYPYIFAFLYFILLMFIETSTIHAFQNKSFLLSSEYLKPYLLYSGGILEYWGIFFNEVMDFNLAGALLYSLLMLVSILLYQRILVKIGMTRNLLLITLFPFVFIFLLTFNHFHPIAYNLKLITGLIFINVFFSVSYQNIFSKVVMTLFLVLLWYMVGLEFFVISLFHIAIFSMKKKSIKKDIFVIFIALTSVLLLNTYVLYTPFSSFKEDILTYGSNIPFLLLLTYVVLILTPVVAIIKLNISLNVFLQFAILLTIGVLLGRRSFNELNHYIGKVMAAGNKDNHNKVLMIRDKTLINSRIISAYTNMALLNKRTLLTNMFKYRQGGGIDGIFPSREFDSFNAYINMRLSFDLGSINSTIRWAMEASTYLGYNAEILRHLILCHLINDNVKAAEKYYAILDKTLFHRKLKTRLKNTIESYKTGENHKIIVEKRKCRPKNDFYSMNGNEPLNFEWALQTNLNHKAVEFYIAVCLLHNDYQRIPEVIPKLIELGYKTLPVHVQEALCLFYAEGNTPPKLYGYEIDPDLFQSCVWFFKTISRYNENLMASKNELMQEAEYTYWFYLYYVSPVTARLNK